MGRAETAQPFSYEKAELPFADCLSASGSFCLVVLFRCPVFQVSVQPHAHIFLQIAVEELVVIQMVYTVRKKEKPRGIFLRRHIRHFQGTALGIEIGSGELRNLGDDFPAVVRKAGAQVLLPTGGVLSVFQLRGLMASVRVPSGIIRESVTLSASLLKARMTPVSSSPEAKRRCGYASSSSSVMRQPMA